MGYDAEGRPAPLIDQVHRLMHLWKAGDVVKVDDYLDARGLRKNALFLQLLQALIELAGEGTEERVDPGEHQQPPGGAGRPPSPIEDAPLRRLRSRGRVMARRKASEADADLAPKADYGDLVARISDLLEESRRGAARAVNRILTATYWEVGRSDRRVRAGWQGRADYGEGLLKRLART